MLPLLPHSTMGEASSCLLQSSSRRRKRRKGTGRSPVQDSIQLGSDASQATASIEPLASLIRLSIISSLQRDLLRDGAR